MSSDEILISRLLHLACPLQAWQFAMEVLASVAICYGSWKGVVEKQVEFPTDILCVYFIVYILQLLLL